MYIYHRAWWSVWSYNLCKGGKRSVCQVPVGAAMNDYYNIHLTRYVWLYQFKDIPSLWHIGLKTQYDHDFVWQGKFCQQHPLFLTSIQLTLMRAAELLRGSKRIWLGSLCPWNAGFFLTLKKVQFKDMGHFSLGVIVEEMVLWSLKNVQKHRDKVLKESVQFEWYGNKPVVIHTN